MFESCNSTWVFDREHMRFRRILKGIEIDRRAVTTEWRPYFGLDVADDSEAFTVLLNSEGTRLIRSWRHGADCAQCGAHGTAERSRRTPGFACRVAPSVWVRRAPAGVEHRRAVYTLCLRRGVEQSGSSSGS